MKTVDVSPLLQLALLIDAVVSAATGVALVLFFRELAEVLALPAALLAGAGAFMLLYAAVVGWMARSPFLPRWAVWSIILGNLLWAVDCTVLAFSGWVAPSALGMTFLLLQAAIVVGFAELQYFGLKRSAKGFQARVADAF